MLSILRSNLLIVNKSKRATFETSKVAFLSDDLNKSTKKQLVI